MGPWLKAYVWYSMLRSAKSWRQSWPTTTAAQARRSGGASCSPRRIGVGPESGAKQRNRAGPKRSTAPDPDCRSSPGAAHGCPVEFFWTRDMALIPLGSGRFADDPDTRRGINAMRHQNSVFHGLLKHLPWDEFDRLVAAHRADSAGSPADHEKPAHGAALRSAGRAASLRDIVTGLQSHAVRLYRGPAAAALDAGRCQRAAAERGIHRAARADDCPRPSRSAPGPGRGHLSDRCNRAQARHSQPQLGALFRGRVRRQAACDL
jgi:hypothetical protein